MHRIKRFVQAYTLLEVTLVIAILAILATTTFLMVRPTEQIERSQLAQAVTELREMGKAVQLYAFDEGAFPADVSRDLPPGIEKYLTADITWPDGPLPGSVYDYDNWSDQTCIDSEASGSIQVTLRQVPGRNPDGSNVWALYYVLQGKGTAHCSSSTEWNKGECVNCPGFEL